ncbi:hypothetical protein LJR071_003528 [Pseudomonas sp. LjRoot71]|uniref:hypothetical protein n=1 Tax=Pseudomonas sp. LjRoot71 TaxID=3342336 RepID=UPI003ECFEBD4
MADQRISEQQLQALDEADEYSLRHHSSEVALLIESYREVCAELVELAIAHIACQLSIAENIQLRGKAESLRKNAERYLWLRDKSEALHSFYLSTPIWMTGVRFRQEDVDRSIDEAIAIGEKADA